ncbi:MAG TPA: MEDS domain-containing protein, partial [Solirubrobacteraceae bacterium]|nr:MEDS domain-containing protein [Solirubrobacteraceae bacterium]
LGVTTDYLLGAGSSPVSMLDHSAFPYRTDEEFRSVMGAFVAEGLERSEGILAVTTARNIELLRDYLGADSTAVEFADAGAWYSTPTAALAAYRSFTEAALAGDAEWVRIVAEPVWAERSSDEAQRWHRYESLCNLVFSASPMSLTCPYDERSLAPEIVTDAQHTHPYTRHGPESSPNLDYTEPEHFAFQP